MHKDNSGVGDRCKHTRKRTGLRRMVNKRNRLNSKRLIVAEIEEAELSEGRFGATKG